MIIPDYDKLNGGAVQEKSIQIHYPEFYEYLISNYKDIPWKEKLYWYYKGLVSKPVCPVCGNETVFINIKNGYRKYCSRKCLNQDPEKKEQVKQTCIDRYGGVAPACSSAVYDKMMKTNVERYGVGNAMQNKEVSGKSQRTNIERYGGCGNASLELKGKQKETLKQIFGVSNYMQSELFYDMIAKRHPDVMSVDIINKRFECKCPEPSCTACMNKTYFIPISNYHSRSKMTSTFKCTITNPIKDNTHYKGTSIEIFIRNILDRYNIEYFTNVRNIISPLELDIYIPSKNIAIECNGVYYHNSESKDKNYHSIKYNLCKQKNIQLLSIWEDWVYQKPNIIESIILSKLGIYQRRIYARKCVVKEISPEDTNLFMDTYHIQGRCPSETKLGLYYKDELVSVMTFANHRNNIIGGNGCELVRFCNSFGTQVIGGAAKLIHHYIKEHHPNSIYSFSSNDISNGNLYQKLGFELGGTNQSYWYVDSKTFKRYHRSSFTKDSIIKRGWRDSKEGWKESDVMKEHGYYQIYDSGQTKWVLKLL